MKHSIKKWKASNYEVEIVFSSDDKNHEKKHVLLSFQKDMEKPWYRKWHVPLEIVERSVDPQYFEMAIAEHIINHALWEVLANNSDIKFIWEPYWYEQTKKDEDTVIKILLDVYPEVEVKNDSWKKKTVKSVSSKVEDSEVEEAILNLKKNYADYQDTEVLEKDTVSKISLSFVDKSWEVLEKWTTYIGSPEFEEDKFWEKTFVGHKKGEVVEVKYDEKKLPIVLQVKDKENHKPTTLQMTIVDVKKQILPEFDEATIEKLFGKDAWVKNEWELKSMIKEQISVNKEQNELVQAVEEYVSSLRNDDMTVIIPKTMIDEEFKSRIHSLEHRFGSKEKVQEYLKSMEEAQAKEFIESIQKAAAESLEKFFILNKVAELLELKLDREKTENLAVERELYNFFNPSDNMKDKSSKTVESKDEKSAKKSVKKSKE